MNVQVSAEPSTGRWSRVPLTCLKGGAAIAGLRLDLFLLQDNTYWEIKSESSVWASCCCWSFCSISLKVVLTWVKMLFSRSRIFDIFAVLLVF